MSDQNFSFKSLFWAYTFAILPITVLFALLALFNVTPVYFNSQPYYGFKGFILLLLLTPCIGITMTLTNWMFLNFGNYLYQGTLKLLGKKKRSDNDRKEA